MNIAEYIDHTILKPDAVKEDIIRVCKEAIEYSFASVCVNPYYVKFVKEQLKESSVKVTCVAGFPLGNTFTQVKVFETRMAAENGADEIDMVINVAALKNKEYDYVLNDIKSVKDATGENILKVILETCLLTDEEIVKACQLCVEAGADFVKTSTGFSSGGATEEHVKLMKKTVGDEAKVKASGSIRDYKTAVKMIKAGAERLGTSSSVEIIQRRKSEKKY